MSDAINLTEEQKQLIEKVGVMHEKGGLQPAPSRVVALLLVSPDTELSFDQIRETLNLSKSASSNAINMLLSAEKIDYITKPGDRKRYFRSKIAFWKDDIKKEFKLFSRVAEIMQEVLDQRPDNTPDFNNKLSEVIDFIEFLNNELPGLYTRWEQSRS
tara:strand:- start:641 stop:1114 length:474 start_codon:yes stop_codon:yes gene_type:complete